VIIDRRYGRPLPLEYGGISATEKEVLHAQELGKSVFFFIRNVALVEYRQLRRKETAFVPEWVEARNKEQWLKFVESQFSLPEHKDRSNWYDEFKTSVDLKQLAMMRLVQQFPEYAGTNAMSPDRLVRMTFVPGGSQETLMHARLRNIGIGPALNVRFGLCFQGHPLPPEAHWRAGVREGEEVANTPDGWFFTSDMPLSIQCLVCEYQNRFSDSYRIELPLFKHMQPGFETPFEDLFVRFGSGTTAKWIKMS
jgi:hypothetical protein